MGILNSPNFRGRSAARLDAKGRLRIPTKFREVLQNHYTDSLFISGYGDCLVAYPPEKWEEMEAKSSNLSQVLPEHRSFVRNFISIAEQCDFDNEGRILIPPLLRKEAHLDREVIIVGALASFEIWDKASWDLQAMRYKENETQTLQNIADSGL
ncbi:MAG: division/cell wall cluster transcriptional repressor MraZ [Syntrophobacteraceae bacterium]